MDIGKHAHSDQREPTSASPTARTSGANVLGTAQREATEKGLYDPFHSSRQPNTSLSRPPLLFSAGSSTLSGGSSLMSHNESRSDPPLQNSIQIRSLPAQPSSVNSGLRARTLQSNPPFFAPGAVAGQSNRQTHVQEPRMTPSNPDPSVSFTLQSSPSLLPVNSLAIQFAPGPLSTNRNNLTGPYMPSSQPVPSFQNPLSQSYMYPGYSPLQADLGQYPPNVAGYFTILQQQPQAYFPPYQHTSPPSIARPPPATGGSGSYVGQQYPPLLYSSNHVGFAQQHQPNAYQWYYPPGTSVPPSSKDEPIQFQHYPVNYTRQSQAPLNTGTLRGHSEEHPLSPGPKHVGTIGPSAALSPTSLPTPTYEHRSAPSSPAIDLTDTSKASTASSTPFHVLPRPPVRRHYHPNPPPNRSEWVMWVGNVPNDATHDELWRFLKQPVSANPGRVGDDGVVSIFLISRSNCAFVNYQSEEHLSRAIFRFNGRQLRPHDRRCPRLVCRARKKEDDLRAGVGAQRGMGVHIQHIKKAQKKSEESAESAKGYRSDPCPIRPSESAELTLVPWAFSDEETAKSHPGDLEIPKVATRSSSSYASTNSSFLCRNFPKRFFILKSLTQYDLDLSVQRGVWATQRHNEVILDQAFRTSREVILIFGVNKSGEFYGYARMNSRILRSDHSISWASRASSLPGSSSHSFSRVQASITPGESDSPSRSGNSQIENRGAEDPRLPIMRASGEWSVPSGSPSHLGVGSSKDRLSAPPALHHQPQTGSISDESPWSSYSSSNDNNNQESAVTSTGSSQPAPSPRWSIELGKLPVMPPVARNNLKSGGAESAGNSGMSLHTVTEELHLGTNGDDLPASSQAGASTESRDPPEDQPSKEMGWGETFNVQWLSTTRVPFHRVRNLRNPWNHGREIKVSRDGTELEPGVGQQLIDQWSTFASEPAEGGSGRNPRLGKRGTRSAAAPTVHERG